MTTAHVDIEEIGTTKSEKLLAVVLTAFVLLGGFWAYARVDDAIARPPGSVRVEPTPAERAAIARARDARADLTRASAREGRAQQDLVLAREAYRTALDAGRTAPVLERAYRAAEAELAAAKAARQAARAEHAAARPAAAVAQRRISAASLREGDRRAFLAFVLRALLALGTLALGLWLVAHLRRRGSRYLPVGFAFAAAGAILALATACDYVTNYIDPLELGPLVLALAGVTMTLGAFWALQRYLARRLPFRRVRKQECPFCGYPGGRGSHCEGCGREIVAACATCGDERRVGTLHCAACGHA